MAPYGPSKDLKTTAHGLEKVEISKESSTSTSLDLSTSNSAPDTDACYAALAAPFLLALWCLVRVFEWHAKLTLPEFTTPLKNLYFVPENNIYFPTDIVRRRATSDDDLVTNSGETDASLLWTLVGTGFVVGLVLAVGLLWCHRWYARRTAAEVSGSQV